jgi:hypothetical protein
MDSGKLSVAKHLLVQWLNEESALRSRLAQAERVVEAAKDLNVSMTGDLYPERVYSDKMNTLADALKSYSAVVEPKEGGKRG